MAEPLWTDTRRNEAGEMYLAGGDVRSIAQELNVSVPTVYRYLQELNIAVRGAVHVAARADVDTEVTDQDTIATFLDAVVRGASIETAADRSGIPTTQAYALCREAGFVASEERSRTRRVKIAVDRYLRGDQLNIITAETGVRPSLIYAYLQQNNLPTRKEIARSGLNTDAYPRQIPNINAPVNAEPGKPAYETILDKLTPDEIAQLAAKLRAQGRIHTPDAPTTTEQDDLA